MFMFYIYIIYSATSDKYYVGYSIDPERRLVEHNNNERISYTSKHRPWELKATFAVSESRSVTMQYEKKIKQMKSRRIIELLIEHKGEMDFLAQLVRVPTGRD